MNCTHPGNGHYNPRLSRHLAKVKNDDLDYISEFGRVIRWNINVGCWYRKMYVTEI